MGLVERDPVKPSRELRALFESRQPPPGSHEYLLRHLIGRVGLEAKAPERTVDAVGVGDNELGERVLITGACSSNQLMLGACPAGHRVVISTDRQGARGCVAPPQSL